MNENDLYSASNVVHLLKENYTIYRPGAQLRIHYAFSRKDWTIGRNGSPAHYSSLHDFTDTLTLNQSW